MVIGGKWGRMESAPRQNSSTGSSRASYYSPLSVSPHLSPKGGPGYSPYSPGYSPAGSALTPVYSTPLTPIDNNYFEVYEHGHDRKRDSQGDIHVTKQPYRTTPLVLPGAKVKREPPTESYLRHHPNPSFRAPPHHTPDYLLKQKLVHKQFNSPINLYSEPNVIDTIHKQTGVKPQIKRKVQFNPAESETYRAIQEEQLGEHVHEVTVPPQSRIYAPNKSIPPKFYSPFVPENWASRR
ncbi:unnamed protein product [Acanthoscelides obtectus]|uniref:Zasp-like motif domain-containing protein n=1 Tax=Acanthoscelides obtectus TaxID=200917 RepID=A0A9P0KKN8_ACAOB|nr:unnamed protein product [Acanthoscelides obtectus]CAK1654517.1 hypothetical protein AOBTE_LOCUS18651 [Acanthoscelides obtectus]